MQPTVLKMQRKMLSDIVWLGRQNFPDRTKNFNTVAEKFYPRIKILEVTIFFLTRPSRQ